MEKQDVLNALDVPEKELIDLIANSEKLVVKVYMDGCSHCTKYAPIFEKIACDTQGFNFVAFKLNPADAAKSEFNKYMTSDGGKISAPATFIFERGEMAFRHYGPLDEMQLRELLMPVELKLYNLYARKGEIMSGYEELPAINEKIKSLEQVVRKKK